LTDINIVIVIVVVVVIIIIIIIIIIIMKWRNPIRKSLLAERTMLHCLHLC
jgi:hypothetical protein